MKTKLFTFLAVVMFLGVCSAKATTIIFESGHHIWTDADPYYDEVFLKNDASLDFLSGSIGKLEIIHYGLTNIFGGNMTSIWTFDDSIAHIHGGDIDILAAFSDSEVYLYTDDFIYSPTGGAENNGYVEGLYYNTNIAFYISFYDDTSYSHLSMVPEPTTFLLFCFGWIALRKRNSLENHFRGE